MNDLDLAIQKRVEVEVLHKLAPIIKRFVKLTADCEALLATMDDLVRTPKAQPNGSAPQGKKPRAAISFTETERDMVYAQSQTTNGLVRSIGQIARNCGLSSRLTGAILRDLVKAGKRVEGPKGRFRAVVETSAGAELDGDGTV